MQVPRLQGQSRSRYEGRMGDHLHLKRLSIVTAAPVGLEWRCGKG